ncbi:MAG: ABC transporter ATP-binding protein [Thermodesulfobacteriota bacterium]
MLEVSNIETRYGNIQALKGISIGVPKGGMVSVLGANGSGKSTLLRTIVGLIGPSSGAIRFEGKSIEGMKPHKVVRLGISLVPENRELFPDLTVHENLLMGAFTRPGKVGPEEIEEIFRYFPVLKERRRQQARTLSGGEQQMLAIARALMSTPRLLLLDEPSLGLAPLMVEEIYRIVRMILARGTTILLVEQNANLALSVASFGYVFENGRVSVSGRSEELLQNEHVKKAYLGR